MVGKGTGQGKLRRISRKSIVGIKDKTKFNKGLSHQVVSNSSKGCYDRDSDREKVGRNNEVDTPQERLP